MASRGQVMKVMKVPEDWRKFSSYNQCIGSTQIIPVKTPLNEAFNAKIPASSMNKSTLGVPLEEEFTPNDFIESLKRKGLVLGSVIDLTNTSRYYKGEEFESANVQYIKLKCVGQMIPDDDVYRKFSEMLNSFLSKNKTKIVAVHCTHGINRTGYLICRYLVEYCGYNVEEAIKAFETARGEKIERKNYLEHLRKGCPKLTSKSSKDSHSSGRYQRGQQPHDTRHDRGRQISDRDLYQHGDVGSLADKLSNWDLDDGTQTNEHWSTSKKKHGTH